MSHRLKIRGLHISKAWGCFLALLFILHMTSCTSENAPDCLQAAGEIVRDEVMLPEFSRITVFENVQLVLKQEAIQKVEIETGEFLRNEVSASVEQGRLILRNENGCNYFREYGLTTIYVSSPNVTEIRSGTGLSITSDGILGYESLTLISESFNNPETETTDGSFDLEIDTDRLSIVANGIAFFKLNGNTESLNITIAAGDSRIEAEDLQALNVSLSHRGTNDIRITPLESISGVIRGTGDVLSFNRPAVVDVEEIYRGRLIFRD